MRLRKTSEFRIVKVASFKISNPDSVGVQSRGIFEKQLPPVPRKTLIAAPL